MKGGTLTSPLIDLAYKGSINGGWASSLYLIGAEFMERFAMQGATGNLMTYLTSVMHQPTATAARNLNVFNGITSLLPLLGAFVADAYLGRFKAILYSSLIYVMGLAMLTQSAWTIPSEFREVALFLSLYLVGIGHGGRKPCLQIFGADQFDDDNLEDKKAKSSFFNWWYFGSSFGTVLGMLVVFYVQENVGWVAGFALPAVAMALGLVIFLLGGAVYKQHKPSGSPLTRIMQVFVAAICKRRVSVLKDDNEAMGVQPRVESSANRSQFTFLDKATIMDDIDVMSTKKNSWRLCTVNQVEDVKLLLRLVPIWLGLLMYAVVIAQASTFFIKQGSTMNTSIGKNFHISPASFQIFIGLAILVFVPVYDKTLIPIARCFTKMRSGISMLQRIGSGMFLATTSMVVAALIERSRVRLSIEHDLLDQPNIVVPMSVWWLLPQFVIMGVSNVFTVIGLQELFYHQMPGELRSIGSAIQLSVFGVGSLLSGVFISTVQYVTSKTGDEWLVDNLNRAHLDYYYWLLAALSTFWLCGFIVASKCFVYKKVSGDYTPLLLSSD